MRKSLYEHPAWQNIPDQTMHPGGLSITTQVMAFCDYPPGSQVLDVGCGTGTSLQYVTSKFDFVGNGIDISAQLLLRARRKNSGIKFAQARGEYLPFANESMDIIISECTLSILDEHVALQELVRVLKPDGSLIISDLYARNENGIAALRELPAGSCISSALTKTQVIKELDQCPLQILVWQDCSDWLKEFPVCTLSTATEMNPFDLVIAAAQAKLGYFFIIARKV